MKLQSLRGFRDYMPPDAGFRADLFRTMREVARRAGFDEVETPSLEALEMFKVKSGEEIVKELFEFKDKGDREVTLIPENTPSLARVYAERAKILPLPVKWFTLPKLWRYEEPQSGRTREFSQVVLDIYGVPGIEAEVEILATTRSMMDAVGLAGRYAFRVNDRRLAEGLGRSLGVTDPGPFFRALDRRAKLKPAEFASELDRAGLDEAARTRLSSWLSRAEGGLPPSQAASLLGEIAVGLDESGKAGAASLSALFARAEAARLGDILRLDLTIVRGLAYYTSTVFEAYDTGGTLRALFGGGRYDKLIDLFGGGPVPACGVAVGDQTLELLMRGAGLWPTAARGLDIYVAIADPSLADEAWTWVRRLRAEGLVTDLDLLGRPLGRQMKEASRRSARALLLLGPQEKALDQVVVRNMRSGQQDAVSASQALAALRSALAAPDAPPAARTPGRGAPGASAD